MKCISIILILSFLYYCLGCYNKRVLKNEDEIRDCLIQKQGIYYITTRDSQRYSFKDHHYRYKFENDTLFGSAKRLTSDPWQKFDQVEFPVSDIYSTETREIASFRTGIFVVVLGAALGVFVINIFNNPGVNIGR